MREKLSTDYLLELLNEAQKYNAFYEGLEKPMTIRQFCQYLREELEYHREQDATHLNINVKGVCNTDESA